jgi:hypothetical protein
VPGTGRSLAVGDSVELIVDARLKDNRLGIRAKAGERFRFDAYGRWRDASIAAPPEGYAIGAAPILVRPSLWAFKPLCRVPAAQYFALVVYVDGAPLTTSAICGVNAGRWDSPADGELIAFANDVSFMYWNNHGRITLRVTRLL